MSKCPLAKKLILTSGGSISYTTPPAVEKLKQEHENFRKLVRDAFNEAELRKLSIEPEEEACLSLTRGERCYWIRGRPDMLYALYGETGVAVLTVEATLSKAVDHIVKGEMIFYMLSSYMDYGCPVMGVVVNPERLYVIFPRSGLPRALERLLSEPPELERAVELAEETRRKHPWACSLCDLRHMCAEA